MSQLPVFEYQKQSLGLMAKVFYSLNYQDLPEFFEDNMKVWMDGFHSLLTAPNIPCLDSGSDDVGGPQEVLKGKKRHLVRPSPPSGYPWLRQ